MLTRSLALAPRYALPHTVAMALPTETQPEAVLPVSVARAARGFSCIFWGIALSLLLFAEVLNIQTLGSFRLPAHILGLVVILAGALWFRFMPPLTPTWARKARILLAAVLIQVYMIPFVTWWKQLPHVMYFCINMMFLLLAAAWLLVSLNRIAAEAGRALKNDILRVEARLCAWVAPLSLLLPALAIARSAWLSTRGAVTLRLDAIYLGSPWLPWTNILLLLPFVLAMAVSWEAKERCLDYLAGMRGSEGDGTESA